MISPPNTGGHRRIRDLLLSKIHGSYTNRWISGPLSHKQIEVGETLNEKIKMEEVGEVRRQGAAILYLTGLFYIPLNAPRYIRAKPFSPRA
jgi:hypothetical protein